MTQPTWLDVQLNRKVYSQYLTNYLISKYKTSNKNSHNESFVLNINAEWGFGKTYFLSNWREDLTRKGFPVIYFDAWQNDFSEDSLLAFISEIDAQLSHFFKKSPKAKALLDTTVNSAKRILSPSSPVLAGILARKFLNISGNELSALIQQTEDLHYEERDNLEQDGELDNSLAEEMISTVISKAAEQALKSHRDKKKSILKFKQNLGKLISHIDKKLSTKKLPLFVLVDELDRCRPNYAIELLENIKHLFGVKGVYFVIATDSTQLAHSIEAIYGSRFDSNRYLRRFFDQEYTLPEPDNLSFSSFLFQRHPTVSKSMFSPLEAEGSHDGTVRLLALYSTFFKLSLRDQEQALSMLEAISFFHDGEKIHLGMILIFVILKIKDSSLFESIYSSGLISKESQVKIKGENEDDRDQKVSYEDVVWSNSSGKQKSLSIADLIDEYIHYSRTPSQTFPSKGLPNSNSSRKISDALYQELESNCHKPFLFSSYIKMVREASQFL
jgi:hypothetical protein